MGRTSPRPRLALLALAVGVLALAALLLGSVYAAPLVEPYSEFEAALGATGDVHRVAGDPATALAESPRHPSLLVLLHPPTLAASEQARLRAFVEDGGTLWVLSARPLSDVLGAGAPSVETWPGSLYQEKGARAQAHAPGQAPFVLPDARALQALPAGARVLATTDPTSFRDSNGNGVLDLGEPSGPFDVAAELSLGAGRVVVVAAPSGLPPAGLVEALAGDAQAEKGVWVAGVADAPLAPGAAHALQGVLLAPETSLLAALLILPVAAALLVLLLKRDVAPARATEETRPGLDAFVAALRASGDADDAQWLRGLSQGGAS